MRATAAFLLTACLLAGCGSGGNGSSGDPLAEPMPDPYGNGSRLHELVGPAPWLNPADEDSIDCPGIPADVKINVTGTTLTAIDDYDETGAGAIGNVYLQDTLTLSPPAYSGMTVFRPATSPPDLRVVNGDVVDLLGFLTEFEGPASSPFPYCRTLPEITGAMQFRFEGTAPVPHVIDVADLRTYEASRKWMGLLVTVEQITMLEDPFESSSGRYSIRIDAGGVPQGEDIPTITNELFDLKNEGPTIAAGQTLQSVTGIVTFFYGIHIAPRSAADIVP